MRNSMTPFLIEHPKKVHLYWWTFAPVLPETTHELAYDRLKRLWFDHTMNTFREKNGVWYPGGRGVYTESCEDHITVALFDNWALFDDPRWVETFLGAYGVTAMNVSDVRWQYAFEEETRGGIADIVLWFKDESGEGLLVIEAKKKGGRFNPEGKDHPEKQPYLHMPSIRPYQRKKYVLLVDETDKRTISQTLGLSPSEIMTWQELGRMQEHFIQTMNESGTVRKYMSVALANRYRHYGYAFRAAEDVPPLDETSIRQTKTRLFIQSAKIFQSIRKNILPTPPMPYLNGALTCLQVYQNHQEGWIAKQTTGDRKVPLWKRRYA